MTKIILGLAIGIAIGAGCRLLNLPVPSPPNIIGALLVVAMTVGYLGADSVLARRPTTTTHLCGGPNGQTAELRARQIAAATDAEQKQ